MSIYILSHADSDGRFAAFAAYKHFLGQGKASQLKFTEVQYNQPFPIDIDSLTKEDRVYILDFAYDREIMDRVCASVGKLVVLDHHETSKDKLIGAEYATFDMTKSGALLGWEYFFPNIDPPFLCRLVDDYDLHTWKYTNHTAALEAWLRYDRIGQDWSRWERLCSDKEYLNEALMKGAVVVDINESVIQSFLRTPNNVIFNSFFSDEACRKINYAIFNGMHHLRNEISSTIYEKNDVDMVIGWSVRGKEVIFSVRSPKDRTNFSAKRFAESYGGGGHDNASAFGLPLDKGLELVKHLMYKT